MDSIDEDYDGNTTLFEKAGEIDKNDDRKRKASLNTYIDYRIYRIGRCQDHSYKTGEEVNMMMKKKKIQCGAINAKKRKIQKLIEESNQSPGGGLSSQKNPK